MAGERQMAEDGTRQKSESFKVAALLAIVGGFLESYTFMLHGHVFANAQTGNIALCGMSLALGDWLEAFKYAIPIVSFALGVALVEWLRAAWRTDLAHWRQIVVVAEIALLSGCFFLHDAAQDRVANLLVSVVCALQVQTFRKVRGTSYASTMCTGNLRSATVAWITWRRTRLASARRQAQYYVGIILNFILGAAVAVPLIRSFEERSVVFPMLLLVGVVLFMYQSNHQKGARSVVPPQVRGFTLIELLVTVLVMATLMGITFRLVHAGDESVARSRTLVRLQRLQNCLAGYHAAFGHYPAVPLHASRDFRLRANIYGVQTDTRDSSISWRNIRAALMAQPVTTEFPFDSRDRYAAADIAEFAKEDVAWAKAAKKKGGDPTAVAVYAKEYKPLSPSLVSSQAKATDWRGVQVFRYGLLSFLLPRAHFMLFGDSAFYEDFAVWSGFNDLAEYYHPETGRPLKGSWAALADVMRQKDGFEREAVLASYSQAVCARWLPNLEGIVRGGGTYYGVRTGDGKLFREREHGLRDAEEGDLFVHASGTPAAPGTAYVLDGMTVLDGWENEFFYYSPAPHRTCRIWSAGGDRRTFPPWVDAEHAAKDHDLKAALEWTRDDIVALLQ